MSEGSAASVDGPCSGRLSYLPSIRREDTVLHSRDKESDAGIIEGHCKILF